jgi:hypothetical protein
MEWHNGRLLVSKQANGGGTLAEVIDSTTIGSQSVSDSDKLDGSHKHEVGNRDYTRTGFFVDGDENTYYPVLITPRGGYAFNRWSISRRYSWTAPWDPIGTGSHKGGLTFDFYWSGDTAWGGNDKAVRIHQFSEQYTTMLGGIRLARTGGMIVWLRGGHAYYELQVDTAPTTVDVKLEAWTDGSGQVFEPTEDVNEHRDTIWNNYPVRHGDELYINNRAVATEQWTDDTFLRTTEKAADSELLDGVNSTSFLRSDTNDTMSGNLTLKYSTADSDDYNALILAAGSNDYIIKASTSRGVFGRKSFGWHVDTSSAFGVYSNGWTKLFGVEGGTGNAFATGTFTANNISTNQVFMQSITSDGTIANDKGSYLHLGGWAVGRTHASAVLVNTAYRADYAESLFDMNISRFTNNSGYITQDSVDALAEELRPQIETAQSTADGKLGATAKAADSNLLDGYDHTAFWKDNEDRRASVIRFTGEGGDSGNGSINYGIYQEGGAWSHPYPDLIIAYHTGIKIGGYKNYGGVKIYNDAPERSGAAQVASFGDGDANVRVANNLHIGSAGGWITDLLNAKATTGDVAGVDARINDEVLPQITTNAENIARNATDIATKLGTTGKAADADKLDGYDWMQSGKSVRANEFYADNWFRSYNSGEGIYNEATGQHWYSDSSSRWRMRSGNGSEAWMMLCTSDNTTRGSFYANNSNEVGILDQGNAWAIKHVNDSGTYFYTDNTTEEFKVGRDVVSGSYGTVQTSTTRSGWGGYSINGAYVFMSDHSSTCGIFNDIDNEWMAIFRRNAEVELMYNGAMKLETTSTGVSVSGNVNASAFIGSLDWSNVTNKPVIPAATEPVQATVEGGQDSTLSSISFSPGEGVATFTLADGQTFRLAFAR